MTAADSGHDPRTSTWRTATFYADRQTSREAYRWMRANQPVFRDRNGLAGATTYQAIIDAERNPELFSSTGGIRPETARACRT